MSSRRQTATTLHIEWTPTWVRVINIETGGTTQAASIAGLGDITQGHTQALVGVGHSHVFVRTLRLPKASPSDLRNILAIQIGQLFPLPPSELSFDFFQTADIDVDGCLTVVGAIRSEDILRIREELRAIGLTASCILPVALAAPAVAARALGAVSETAQDTGEALVVQSSPTGLSLDIVQGGTLRLSRVVALGSDPAAEAQRTLAAARATDLPVVVSGGLIEIPGSIPTMDSELGLLRDAAPFDFELAEDRIREAKQRVSTLTRQAVLCALAALALVTYVWANWQDAQAQVIHSRGTWSRQITTKDSIESDESAKTQQLTSVSQDLDLAFKPGQQLSDINAVISDSLPAGAWLTGVTLERGKAADVRGTATTAAGVTKLVDTLGNNPRFRNVRLVFANSATIQSAPVVQFDITMTCTGSLPMPAPEVAKPKSASSSFSSTATTTDTTAGGSQ